MGDKKLTINEVKNKIKNCNMLTDIDKKELLDYENGYAYIIAKDCKNNGRLKTAQLRKFFDAIKEMEKNTEWEKVKTDFYLFKPRMAVSVGRGHVSKKFYDIIMIIMNKVDVGKDEEKIDNLKCFVELFEAIVAYHKYLEAKE